MAPNRTFLPFHFDTFSNIFAQVAVEQTNHTIARHGQMLALIFRQNSLLQGVPFSLGRGNTAGYDGILGG